MNGIRAAFKPEPGPGLGIGLGAAIEFVDGGVIMPVERVRTDSHRLELSSLSPGAGSSNGMSTSTYSA